MTLYAQFYQRGSLDSLTERGDVFDAIAAEGGESLSAIGYGKVSVPAYDNFRRSTNERIQPGDLCLVWSTAPYLTAKRPLLVACFIVETRQQKEDERYEVSGPDLLGELMEFYAVAPIGEQAEVVVSAVSLGQTTVNHPEPEPDTFLTLEAAYPPRMYQLADEVDAGKYRLFFDDATTIQVGDTLRVVFADGEVFTTTITDVHERRKTAGFADPAPQEIPADTKIEIWSTRIRVSDGSALIEGSYVFYTPGTAGGNIGTRPTGNLYIDRIELGDGVNDPDYIYTADPIPDQIDDGSPLTQRQYIAPTTGDIALLFFQSTSTFATPPQWAVIRSPLATTGTAYAPNRESVWDVLLAIREMSGYEFRRYFRGLPTPPANSQPRAKPVAWFTGARQIEYFPNGSPVVSGEVTSLSTAATIAVNHGTILKPIQTEDVAGAITTLFPFGGGAGSGSFDFRLASIITILAEYGNAIGWGIINNQYFIYNKALVAAGVHLVDAVETFAHISPIDHTSFDARKEAADQLLRAACDWLLLHDEPQVTYVAEVFTIGEPRPGDVVSLNYSGDAPHTTSDISLIITEVSHRVGDDTDGLRYTTLTLNKAGFKVLSGPRVIADHLANLKRGFRQANIGARGDARISYDKMEFGRDATVDSKTGNLLMRSVAGDVTIRAETGDVYLDGNTIDISGTVESSGLIRSESGFVFPDEAQANDWVQTVRTVRGIPRATFDYRDRSAT